MSTPQSAPEGRHPIQVIQGAQWGSCAKGAAAGFLAVHNSITHAVRTGTVNAGHTVYYNGKPYVMQQLPVGWVNPNCQLVLGPGAYIYPEILAREIAMVNLATGLDCRNRLYIDHRCGLHLPEHVDKAKVANRHHKMGATGKGCSEAVVAKIAGRGTDRGRLFIDWISVLKNSDLSFTDTSRLLNDAYDSGGRIQVEGTQGTLLDLHLGPYPYTTHKQTQAASWLAECGLSASLPIEVVLVARTYPIRVAGNSGPMPGEIRWPDLARTMNLRLSKFGLPPIVSDKALKAFDAACREVATDRGMCSPADPQSPGYEIEYWPQSMREKHPEFVSELHRDALGRMRLDLVQDLSQLFELTTVTKKVRRIAEMDINVMKESVRLNRPSYIYLTFANYKFPEMRGWTATDSSQLDARRDAGPIASLNRMWDYVHDLEAQLGVPIKFATTGPGPEHVLSHPCHVPDADLQQAHLNLNPAE